MAEAFFMTDQISLYEAIGGEAPLKSLVKEFYDFMDSSPETAGIRAQHQKDLSEAREKLFQFLSGWMGGPSLYIEKYGHPRLRARHLPFAIGLGERDQWLLCMWKALEVVQFPADAEKIFKSSIYRLADHMRNQQE